MVDAVKCDDCRHTWLPQEKKMPEYRQRGWVRCPNCGNPVILK